MSDDNGAAFAELDRMILVCRSLDATMLEQATPAVAEQLRTVVAESVAAGRSPEGEAWKPTKAGNMPLRGAMAAVTVMPDSTGVTVTLEGYHVFHQRGTHSQGANKAAKSASAQRKAAKRAAREAKKAMRTADKAVARANRVVERRLDRRTAKAEAAAAAGKKLRASRPGKISAAEEKANFATNNAKRLAARAKAEEAHAGVLKGRAEAAVGVGGLPARPIIPQNMPMNLSEALRTLFRERYESHMRGDE